MSLFYVRHNLFFARMLLRDFGAEAAYQALKPIWKQLAHYRIILLEAELYRADSAGPFGENQFGRVKGAVRASVMHLQELNARIAYLEECRRQQRKPKGILNYKDIAHYAKLSHDQLVSALMISRDKPTGQALFLLDT